MLGPSKSLALSSAGIEQRSAGSGVGSRNHVADGQYRVSCEVRCLIRRMAAENPTWGEERIADELLLKLHIQLSARTVAKYMRRSPHPRGSQDQRWASFVRNHARGIVACDFFCFYHDKFRILYVFVALEIGSGRSFTSTSPRILPLIGHCSNFAKPFPATTSTSFFFMIDMRLSRRL
jgi:hypothetical protein